MVAVLEAWTSPPGSGIERRTLFGDGETLQLNAVFVTERTVPSRVRVHFVVESEINSFAELDSEDFDTIFRPQLAVQGDFTVGSAAARCFFALPITVPRARTFTWRGRRNAVTELSGGGFDSIFLPTLYSFRTIVRLLDVSTGLAFDVSDPWKYAIQA